MKKILYVATSDIHINIFHLPFLHWLKQQGYEVHLAVENRGNLIIPYIDIQFNLQFPRSPFNKVYLKTFKELKKIIDINKYDLIHCHTPMPSVIARLAAIHARKNGTKVLYTAHGLHFFKGAPLKNWLTYYPVEYILSAFTDCIITMNQEDYRIVNGKMLHHKSYIIPGVGVDPNKFQPYELSKKITVRQEFGYFENNIIIIYVAEFIKRKNHQLIIKAVSEIKHNIDNLKVLFVGGGPLLEEMKIMAKNENIDHIIDFLGFRNDVSRITAISDIGISASRHEGLPIGILQEMFSGLPIVASVDRGHNELIIHGVNGFLYMQNNHEELLKYIMALIQDSQLRAQMGQESLKMALKFRVENSIAKMAEIYNSYLI